MRTPADPTSPDPQEIQKAREQEGQPDSDGWVLVTRHSKRPVARRTEGLDQRLKEKLKKKRQRQQMVNLYNFQLKDTKMEREWARWAPEAGWRASYTRVECQTFF